MTSPLRYDFLKTFRSKSVLISMAVIVALSLGLIPLVSLATAPTSFNPGGSSVAYYYSGSEYHLLGYSYNTYGHPVQGTRFNLTISSSSGTFGAAATTNSSGFAEWTLQAPSPGNNSLYYLRVNGAIVAQGGGSFNYTKGEVNYLGGQQIALVTDSADSSRSDVLVFSEGSYGALPAGWEVYYNYSTSVNGGVVTPVDRSQMTLLGVVSGYVTLLKLPSPPSGANTITVAVYDSNGNVFASSSQTTIGGSLTPPSPTQLFTSVSSSILALVVPLMAILVSYNSYGKDKATGVLDSILTRPVTRRGLGISRYVAILTSLAVAIAIAVGAMAAISQALLGKTIPLDFALLSLGGLVVEGAAFVGIMMGISHFLRSSGGLIGVGVVLWVLLDFLWGILILVAALFMGIQIGSGNYLALSIRSGFVNPAQYYGLVGQYLNGISLVASGSSIPISPATYGITAGTLLLTAAFWVGAPLLALAYVTAKRD